MSPTLIPNEDHQIQETLTDYLARKGIKIYTNQQIDYKSIETSSE